MLNWTAGLGNLIDEIKLSDCWFQSAGNRLRLFMLISEHGCCRIKLWGAQKYEPRNKNFVRLRV